MIGSDSQPSSHILRNLYKVKKLKVQIVFKWKDIFMRTK